MFNLFWKIIGYEPTIFTWIGLIIIALVILSSLPIISNILNFLTFGNYDFMMKLILIGVSVVLILLPSFLVSLTKSLEGILVLVAIGLLILLFLFLIKKQKGDDF